MVRTILFACILSLLLSGQASALNTSQKLRKAIRFCPGIVSLDGRTIQCKTTIAKSLKLRKKKQNSTARAATTQPTTRPTTRPSTQPLKPQDKMQAACILDLFFFGGLPIASTCEALKENQEGQN